VAYETSLNAFAPLTIAKNQRLVRSGRNADRMLAYRTSMDLWGQSRAVVVTYNPRTARKHRYTLERKLDTLRETLIEFRRNYREQRPQWRDPKAILERYLRACDQLHLGSQYYRLEFGDRRKAADLSFRKDPYQVSKAENLFGKNVIVTDNHDWTTEEIVQSSLDRYGIEQQFRTSKATEHIRINPFYHWTDSKLRCHLLTCVMALTVLRLIELRVQNHRASAEHSWTGRKILEDMHKLHSAWLLYPGKRKPERMHATPTEDQAEVLRAFGYEIAPMGVLQPLAD